MLGSGIYSSIISSANIAGPSVVITYIITSICCIFSSLPFAEFASYIPDTGAAYSYVYASIGEFVAFLYYCK